MHHVSSGSLSLSKMVVCRSAIGISGSNRMRLRNYDEEKKEEEGRLCRLQVYLLFLFGVIDHALKVEGDG